VSVEPTAVEPLTVGSVWFANGPESLVVPVVVVAVVVVPVVVVPVVVVGDVVVVCPGAPELTTDVGLDVATEEPFLFVAVTLIRNVEPTSPDVIPYDAEPLPTAEHELPDASQRCHWKL
jgi:hypothetical protein